MTFGFVSTLASSFASSLDNNLLSRSTLPKESSLILSATCSCLLCELTGKTSCFYDLSLSRLFFGFSSALLSSSINCGAAILPTLLSSDSWFSSSIWMIKGATLLLSSTWRDYLCFGLAIGACLTSSLINFSLLLSFILGLSRLGLLFAGSSLFFLRLEASTGCIILRGSCSLFIFGSKSLLQSDLMGLWFYRTKRLSLSRPSALLSASYFGELSGERSAG